MSAQLISGAGQSRAFVTSRFAALRRTPRGRVALYVISIGLIALAYYLAGRVGLEMAYLDGAVAAAWPPAGVGLAGLVLYCPAVVPGLVIRDLLVAGYSTPPGTGLAHTGADTHAL